MVFWGKQSGKHVSCRCFVTRMILELDGSLMIGVLFLKVAALLYRKENTIWSAENGKWNVKLI